MHWQHGLIGCTMAFHLSAHSEIAAAHKSVARGLARAFGRQLTNAGTSIEEVVSSSTIKGMLEEVSKNVLPANNTHTHSCCISICTGHS